MTGSKHPSISRPEKNKDSKIRALGLCIGGSTVSAAVLEAPGKAGNGGKPPFPKILWSRALPHEGNPKAALVKVLNEVGPESFDRIAVTGRRFHKSLRLSHITEPEAVERAYRFTRPGDINCPAVVSAGGETFMAYVLTPEGTIRNVLTGNKCASGTGEFFLQQLRRMDATLEEAAGWAETNEPYPVSGRCSVFCKSDCTHATNKGVPKPRVVAGLCRMMAEKILELLKNVERKNVMLTGGTSANRTMVAFLKEAVPGLVIPEEAPYFEALGVALWALDNPTLPYPGEDRLFFKNKRVFDTLPPLADFRETVVFESMERGEAKPGDETILGLDVGSTTTKAVLLRTSDDRILASEYLRTNGDPVGASRRCYRSLLEQIKKETDPESIAISGLGVCGSGRQIAGLHALTDGVINEIIAHATAAAHFDPRVETIFEIGGQDAKYTHLVNGVPSDYAMNEACSAGTGSFLEESAWETLGVKMEDIAGIAERAASPPNFNDQCAAFIASDIKNAAHEGLLHEDIVGGLVYSICMNYANRVKGSRPVGERVFMQGGVCYNRAVPLAMAALTGKRIVVPPEPGLMGAFGVALEVKKRIAAGLMEKASFDLKTLVARDAVYEKPFICKGGRDRCDRRCQIEMVRLEGKSYPFGGACNRYEGVRSKNRPDRVPDLTRNRMELLFPKSGKPDTDNGARRIGINRSFLTHTYYPLYAEFFSELGLAPVMPEAPSRRGVEKRSAPFCYPAELSHGFFHTLLSMDAPPEAVFLPHFKALPDKIGERNSQVCPFVQGEPYFLRTAFQKEIRDLEARGTRFLTPLLDLTAGLDAARGGLLECARELGFEMKEAGEAFARAKQAQENFEEEMRALGRRALEELEQDPSKTGVVLFGRPYNAYAPEAHKGIPRKLASRGVPVIPLDFLDLDPEPAKEHMYWGMGQRVLNAARFVKKHPQLFGVYVTNFSCGPDSFILTYFREIMGRKPSLTLELDSHTADAGIETRVEAFLDIVSAFRKLEEEKAFREKPGAFVPAATKLDGKAPMILASDGSEVPLTDPRVTLLFPSMGRIATETVSAVFEGMGFHTVAHPPSDESVLKIGRANTSCKECLPLILTAGSLLNYVKNRKPGEIVVYFLPTASGPCRFGQYRIFLQDMVQRLRIPDVGFWSPSSDNTYGSIGPEGQQGVWRGVVVSDAMEDIRAMLLANARNTETALEVFWAGWEKVRRELAQPGQKNLLAAVSRVMEEFSAIPVKRPFEEVPRVSLVGEIFVRRDGLSRQYITERLAREGIAAVCAPIAEWVWYVRWEMEQKIQRMGLSHEDTQALFEPLAFMREEELRFQAAMERSGLISPHPVDMDAVMAASAPFISSNLSGEAVLTVGSALAEVGHHTCGAIAIGPFGCMPNRLSEAILSVAMNSGNGRTRPFLAVESDGSPFPQLVNARLEAFCLQAMRLHEKMRKSGRKTAKRPTDYAANLAGHPATPHPDQYREG